MKNGTGFPPREWHYRKLALPRSKTCARIMEEGMILSRVLGHLLIVALGGAPTFLATPAGADDSGHHHKHSAAMHSNMKSDAVDTSTERQTPNFRVTYTSEAMPIPINTLHSWRLKIATPQGKPVEGAAITLTGDMPAHGHGLPTKPEVTREISNGVYLVEGMKFSMPGHWVVQFHIAANGKEDTAAFDLVLK